LAFAGAQGKTICTGSADATLRIWNPKSGESFHVVQGMCSNFHINFLYCLSSQVTKLQVVTVLEPKVTQINHDEVIL
jgi:WD40 repeat protein